mgnify:CR=1 FL=1
MTDLEFAHRAAGILHNMSLERRWSWFSLFRRRWHISDEPLRNDAANLLREYGYAALTPNGFQRVGDDAD